MLQLFSFFLCFVSVVNILGTSFLHTITRALSLNVGNDNTEDDNAGDRGNNGHSLNSDISISFACNECV